MTKPVEFFFVTTINSALLLPSAFRNLKNFRPDNFEPQPQQWQLQPQIVFQTEGCRAPVPVSLVIAMKFPL